MMPIITFVLGSIMGSLWTAWVMQRSINRQNVIPVKRARAKVFTPTEEDHIQKNKDQVKRIKNQKHKRVENEWKKMTGLPNPLEKLGKRP